MVYVQAKNGFIIAYDNTGEKAWAKFIADGFGSEEDKNPYLDCKPLQMMDVDGDGISEILLSGAFSSASIEERQYIYCYNNDGSLRWKTSFKPQWQFTGEKVPNIYTAPTFLIRPSLNSKKSVVNFIFTNGYYFPAALAELNPLDGMITKVYYNPGAIAGVAYAGKFESLPRLFVFGENNSFDKAFLSILNPEDITGAAPGDFSRIPAGMGRARHYAYILFPPVLPKPISSSKRDVVTNIKVDGDSALIATISVKVDNKDFALFFHFNKEFSCIGVDADDMLLLEMEHRKLAGKPYVNITTSYLDSLKSKVIFIK